mgnify:CR=1 FL=1
MKTKAQKVAEARKNAEAIKAKKKAERTAKSGAVSTNPDGKKGKSLVPQSKAKK